MKIAIFTDTYLPQINGVATASAALAKALRQNGEEVLVVCPNVHGEERETFYDHMICIPGMTMKSLYSYKITGFYSQKAFDKVKEFRPDVIHVQTEVGMGIFGRLCAGRLNVPLVYTYHTMYADYTYYVSKSFQPVDNLLKKGVASLSSFLGDSTTEFVTTSEKTKEALIRYGVNKYINVVPNGIDLSSFFPQNVDLSKVKEVREKYGLEGKKTVLVLGRLAKEKSVDVVLENLRAYLDWHPDFPLKLLVVGDGPDKKNIEKYAEKLNLSPYVEFLGAQDHSLTPYFYYAADVYISASVTETQGLTYIEAMASHTLVFARYDLNLKDVIHDGKTGFFFTDQASFVDKFDKIMYLSEEEKKQIEDSAYEEDVDQYSLDLYYKRIHNVYLKAVRKYW